MSFSSASSLLSKATATLFAILTVPLTIAVLGSERYGLWMTATTLVGNLSFADLGLGNGLITAISEADGQDDRTSMKTAISSSFFTLLLIAIAVFSSFAVAAPLIHWKPLFNLSTPQAIKDAPVAVMLMVLYFAINLPLGIVQRVQIATQRGYISNLFQAAANLSCLLAVYLAVVAKWQLPGIIVASVYPAVIINALNSGFEFWHKNRDLRPRWSRLNFQVSASLLRTGSHFLILQLCVVIGYAADSLVLAHTLGPIAVAQYAIVQRLFQITLISDLFVLPLWPAIGEALSRGDRPWVRQALRRSFIITLTITLLLTVPLLIWGHSIVRLLTHSQLTVPTSLVVAFAAWRIFGVYQGNMSVLLNHRKTLARQVRFFAVASLLSFSLKVFLVHAIGISGVILATLIGFGLCYAWPAAKLARDFLSIDPPTSTEACILDT